MRSLCRVVFLHMISVVCAISIGEAYGQSCDWDIFARGSQVTFEIRTWPNPYYSNPEFPRLNENRKERAIEEYMRDIETGRIQPTISNFTYTVTVSDIRDAVQMVELEASAYGQTFTSQMLCQADTMYVTRNKYPLVTEANGKVVGFAIQGTQTIPMPLSVGDVLPPFEDIAVTIPENSSFTVPDSVMTGYREVEYISTITMTTPDGYERGSYYQTGQPAWTPERGHHYVHTQHITQTRLEPIYERFHVGVNSVLQTFMYNRVYAYAVVSGAEDIDLLGTTQTALVIDAQSVGKAFTQKTFESASEEIADRLGREFRQHMDGAERMVVDMGYLEEGGYNITYGRDWFVPGFGIVKKASYSKYGGLQNETILASIR